MLVVDWLHPLPPYRWLIQSKSLPATIQREGKLSEGTRSSRERSFSRGGRVGVEPIPTTKTCVVFFSVIVLRAAVVKMTLKVLTTSS